MLVSVGGTVLVIAIVIGVLVKLGVIARCIKKWRAKRDESLLSQHTEDNEG